MRALFQDKIPDVRSILKARFQICARLKHNSDDPPGVNPFEGLANVREQGISKILGGVKVRLDLVAADVRFPNVGKHL